MAHNPFPFTHDSHPDLTAAIRGVVSEAHTRAQLEKLSITRLRELLKQYTAKPGSGRELADIRGLLRAKGAGSVVDEACWKGYTASGLKRKGKRMVPDCVKEEMPREQAAVKPLKGAEQLHETVIPVGALMLLPMWIKQAIVIALVGGTALSYVLDQLHGLRLTTLDKETREQTLAVHEWAKRKAKRDGIKAAKAALLKGHKTSKGKKPQSKDAKPVSEGAVKVAMEDWIKSLPKPVVAEAFRFRQQDWEMMRAKYKQGTPVNITLKSGKTVSGTLLRMDKYDQGGQTKGHLLHVKTSSGRVEVDDVDVKSIQWNNDSKTKMSEAKVSSKGSWSGSEEDEEIEEEWKSLKKTKVDLNALRQQGYKIVVQHGEGDTLYKIKGKGKKVDPVKEHLDDEVNEVMVKVALNPNKKIGYQVTDVGPGGKRTVSKSENFPEEEAIIQVREAGHQTLYRYMGKYYIVSYSSLANETMVFAGDAKGKPTSYTDLWSDRGGVHPDAAIKAYLSHKFKKDLQVKIG